MTLSTRRPVLWRHSDSLGKGSLITNRHHKDLPEVPRTCNELGVPATEKKKKKKKEGPSTTLTLLDIKIDTVQQELRLPHEKLERLGELIVMLVGNPPAFVIFRFTFEQIPFDIQKWSIFTSF